MNMLCRNYARNLSTVVIIMLFSTSLWQLASAGWIQSKAIIAQQLLNHSWHRTIQDASDDKEASSHRPWPWADTWPVAKLIVPQHHIELIILAGDSGSSLAFGPGYSFASAAPNAAGTSVISAHRDTHFNFLRNLKINEKIIIKTADSSITYQVHVMQIVDSKTFKLQPVSDEKTIVLVTCYPFDSLETGGSLRYLVYATRVMTEDEVTPLAI